MVDKHDREFVLAVGQLQLNIDMPGLLAHPEVVARLTYQWYADPWLMEIQCNSISLRAAQSLWWLYQQSLSNIFVLCPGGDNAAIVFKTPIQVYSSLCELQACLASTVWHFDQAQFSGAQVWCPLSSGKVSFAETIVTARLLQ